MRPIDADAYANHLENVLKESVVEVEIKSIQGFLIAATLTEAIVSDLKDEAITPTIDAVEVVRCGECKWRNNSGRCTYIAQIYPPVASNHFCGYGARKE